jgi:hypothetical protein
MLPLAMASPAPDPQRSERGDWARLVASTGRAFSFYRLMPRRRACAGCGVNRANKLPLAKLDYSSRRIVHGAGHAMRGLSTMLHNLLDAISNPGVAATVLLVGFIGVMTWAWWPAGFLLP